MTEAIVKEIEDAVDIAIVAGEKKRTRRKYIGASSIGDECQRKIQYRYLNYPVDPDKELQRVHCVSFSLGMRLRITPLSG